MKSQINIENRNLQIIVNDLKRYNPERVILFGSGSRGEMDENSDIDILIVKKTEKRFLQRLKEVALLLSLDEPIDILVYTPSEIEEMKRANNFFLERVEKEGRVIYEREYP